MDAELAKLALQVLEDSRDAEIAEKRMAAIRNGEPTYTTEELAAELGLDLDEI
jgi:hypothetical protein